MKNKISKTFYIILTICLLITVINITTAYANIFQYDIQISSEGNSTKEAQTNALTNGRLEALRNTIGKITSKMYQAKIDTLLEDRNLTLFEKSFSVADENFISRNYSANATFIFDEKRIYDFLNSNNIPFVKNLLKDNTLLIIPIFVPLDKNNNSANTSNNAWNNYWIDKDNRNKFLTTLVYYNPPNLNFLSNQSYLESIKKNLKVNDVFMLYLQENTDESYNLSINNYDNSKVAVYNNINFNEAISLAAKEVEETSKNSAITIYSHNQIIDKFSIEINRFSDWSNIKKQLDLHPSFIQEYSLLEMNPDNIKIVVKHKSTIMELKEKFDEICIILNENNMSLKYNDNCI